jgi:transposase-like protein
MDSLENMNLMTLMEDCDTQDECRSILEELRWPDGPKCPRCQSAKISHVRKRFQYDCDSCRYQFSVTAGTMFQDTHISLVKWFAAIYLMMESKKGMSANQLKRTLHVGYQTAWFLCHRIRKAIEEAKQKPKLDGTVEVDETYVGGKYDARRKRERYDKQAVIGLLQRDGTFEARTIKRATRKILTGIVRDRVTKGAKVYTDELPAYKSLDRTYEHGKVMHHRDEWVRGDVHTNSVESAWSLFKRSIVGSFHQISRKHMDAYLDEFEWRFNNRENPFLFRDTLIRLVSSSKMEYKELVKKTA